MADEVRGIAVLDDRNPEQFLFCVAWADPAIHGQWTDTRISRIPIRPKGSPKVGENQWEYEVAGESLHVTPSLKISTTRPVPGTEYDPKGPMQEIELFHNGGAWDVRFVRWSDIRDWAELDDSGRYTACRLLNREYFPHVVPPGG